MDTEAPSRAQDAVPAAISMDAVVVAAAGQISTTLGEEAVILHTHRGVYFGLDPVGTVIWNLLQDRRRVRDIRDRLLQEYDVEPRRCDEDLLALLQHLVEQDLIELLEPECSS